MIGLERLRDRNIFVITPNGPLEKADFEQLTEELDPFAASKGTFARLMIRAESFPGWRNWGALVSHVKFVAAHQRHIERIAVVTNSRFLRIVPHIARHLVRPEIKPFGFEGQDRALVWLETGQ